MTDGQYVPHDLFLQCPFRDQPVDVNNLLLSDSVRSVHRLHILHRIPVVLNEYYRISSRKCQAKTTDVCREQQTVNARIRIECLHDGVSFISLCSAI